MATDFSFELHDGADGCRLELRGELDLATRDQLRDALRQAVARSRAVIEVDLREVTFLDCVSVGVLVEAGTAARLRGGAVVVSHAQGLVRLVLELTGVNEHFEGRPVPEPPPAAPGGAGDRPGT